MKNTATVNITDTKKQVLEIQSKAEALNSLLFTTWHSTFTFTFDGALTSYEPTGKNKQTQAYLWMADNYAHIGAVLAAAQHLAEAAEKMAGGLWNELHEIEEAAI